MTRSYNDQTDRSGSESGGAGRAPGRRTLTMQLAVQRSRAPASGEASVPDGGGRPLPSGVATDMGRSFGADFSQVRFQEGEHVSAMGARAFALGHELHFAPGEFAPQSTAGRELIGHELAHVVQQSQGRVAPTMQAKGADLNDDPALEAEADRAGAAAARGEPVGGALTPGTATTGAVQRKIVLRPAPESNSNSKKPYDGNLDTIYNGVMRRLGITNIKDERLKLLDKYLYSDGKEFEIEVAHDAKVTDIVEAICARFKEEASDEEHDDDDDDLDMHTPVCFYHGTSLEDAETIVSGCKLDARGMGELGGGFYLTHDPYEAAHIGDYYCQKDKKKKGCTKWAVVQFSIVPEQLQELGRKHVDIREYRKQDDERSVESPYDWTVSRIVDTKTPYVQHLFAQQGLNVLNHKSTIRTILLKGGVGEPKPSYSKKLPKKKFTDPKDDRMFELGKDLDEEEEDEEDEDELDPSDELGKHTKKDDDEDEPPPSNTNANSQLVDTY